MKIWGMEKFSSAVWDITQSRPFPSKLEPFRHTHLHSLRSRAMYECRRRASFMASLVSLPTIVNLGWPRGEKVDH